MTYVHQHETDYFYDERLMSGEPLHIRVTRDSKTKELKPGGVVAKQRIADLNVYSPRRPFDFRISISTETPTALPPETSTPVYSREKDRLSYAHQIFQVDLTQVTLPTKPQEPLHELEIEFRKASELIHYAFMSRGNHAEAPQDWTAFEDLTYVFLNNIRLLIRNNI